MHYLKLMVLSSFFVLADAKVVDKHEKDIFLLHTDLKLLAELIAVSNQLHRGQMDLGPEHYDELRKASALAKENAEKFLVFALKEHERRQQGYEEKILRQ